MSKISSFTQLVNVLEWFKNSCFYWILSRLIVTIVIEFFLISTREFYSSINTIDIPIPKVSHNRAIKNFFITLNETFEKYKRSFWLIFLSILNISSRYYTRTVFYTVMPVLPNQHSLPLWNLSAAWSDTNN